MILYELDKKNTFIVVYEKDASNNVKLYDNKPIVKSQHRKGKFFQSLEDEMGKPELVSRN